jgi:hypothetical protein
LPTVAQTLRELPTLANGLKAESWPNSPDLENRFLHQWMRYGMDCSFAKGDFQMEKRVHAH